MDERPVNDQGWPFVERRVNPYHYEMENLIRTELDKVRRENAAQLHELLKAQNDMQREIDRFNTSARIIQWIALGTAGAVGAVLALFDWMREHVK